MPINTRYFLLQSQIAQKDKQHLIKRDRIEKNRHRKVKQTSSTNMLYLLKITLNRITIVLFICTVDLHNLIRFHACIVLLFYLQIYIVTYNTHITHIIVLCPDWSLALQYSSILLFDEAIFILFFLRKV
jgi:hypothetical protein